MDIMTFLTGMMKTMWHIKHVMMSYLGHLVMSKDQMCFLDRYMIQIRVNQNTMEVMVLLKDMVQVGAGRKFIWLTDQKV